MSTIVEPDLQIWLDQAADNQAIDVMALFDTQNGFQESLDEIQKDVKDHGFSWERLVPFRFLDAAGIATTAATVRYMATHKKIRMLVLAHDPNLGQNKDTP